MHFVLSAAHPRSRGENSGLVSVPASSIGSSPLTRGKHTTLTGWVTGIGLIPAHAGKTRWYSAAQVRETAHPRSRGENSLLTPMLSDKYGSSPLTRGKLRWVEDTETGERLIPAHAGKTTDVSSARHSPAAHPRSRGENDGRVVRPPFASGSSPLTRGKPLASLLIADGKRLIPAHAGKTHRLRSSRAGGPAHPRSRGENARVPVAITGSPGSSPLTRGKQLRRVGVNVNRRLIPAHAGKTGRCGQSVFVRAAHPRSRGENAGDRPLSARPRGSSPLTRGKRVATWESSHRPRLIPAHAGKTSR